MFQNRPSLAVELLREVFGVEVPEHSEVRTGNAGLTEVQPAEYRADLVVVLWAAERPVLGVIVEAQLKARPRKRYSWPVYLMGLRARLECPCVLLVVTPSEATARWAARPIEVGCGTLTPRVVGPKRVPVVTDVERAKRDPELSLLSVMASCPRRLSKPARQVWRFGKAFASTGAERTRVREHPRAAKTKPKPKIAGRAESLRYRGW